MWPVCLSVCCLGSVFAQGTNELFGLEEVLEMDFLERCWMFLGRSVLGNGSEMGRESWGSQQLFQLLRCEACTLHLPIFTGFSVYSGECRI